MARSTSPDSRREVSSSGPLPTEQPRVTIPLILASTRTMILVFSASFQDACQTVKRMADTLFVHGKSGKYNCKPSSLTVSSLGASHTSIARNPKAPTTAEYNPFAALEEKNPAPSNNPLEATGTSTQGKSLECSTDPVDTSKASSLPEQQGVTPSLPDPREEEGEVTPGDADIPGSIARALLDALQERWTGNNLPPAVIPVARIRATQLRQCLLTGKEPSVALSIP